MFTEKLIGTICLFDFSEDHSKVEIGFELLPDFQGQGIMQEAASKVIHFGFQKPGLNSIIAFTHSANQASIRVLEKLKFKMARAADENFTIFKLTNDC